LYLLFALFKNSRVMAGEAIDRNSDFVNRTKNRLFKNAHKDRKKCQVSR
jgi:hypothetical protein